jgi:polypeptide N-acetylgalactosaminyltransferase
VFSDGKLGNYETHLDNRLGPGENGEGIQLTENQKSRGKQSVREYGFNMVASSLISMDRRIKDTRHSQ